MSQPLVMANLYSPLVVALVTVAVNAVALDVVVEDEVDVVPVEEEEAP